MFPKGTYVSAVDAPSSQRALPPNNLDTQQDRPSTPIITTSTMSSNYSRLKVNRALAGLDSRV